MFAQCVEPHAAHSINPVDGSISFMGRFIVDEEIDGSGTRLGMVFPFGNRD
jgi:hypothetical protein